MDEELRALWSKPIKNLPTFIDLGRLAKRIDVFVESETSPTDSNSVGLIPGDQAASHKPDNIGESLSRENSSRKSMNNSKMSRADCLARVVQSVAACLESATVNSAVSVAIPKFVEDAGDNLDYRVYVEELFLKFEEDSPSVRLFKMVNQATLFIAITNMKSCILRCQTTLPFDTLQTKDCRGPDGWRVEIRISPSSITVTHVRKDQSLGIPFAPDYWDIQWRFIVCFTPDMLEIKHSKIEILNMTFGREISAKVKNEIKRVYYESICDDYTYSKEVIDDDSTCSKCCNIT